MNYKYENYPYFEINQGLYPNREQQLNFIRSYLNTDNKSKRQIERDVDTKLIEKHMLIEVNYFALAAHFFWSLWAICQASSNAHKKFSFLVNIGKQKMSLCVFIGFNFVYFSIWRSSLCKEWKSIFSTKNVC